MSKVLPIIIIFLNILLISKARVLAQIPPKSIKLGSFTPPPTRTPTATPTRTPTLIPSGPPAPSEVPEPSGGNGGGNPAECAKLGLSMFSPQPRFLEQTTLCELGVIWPPYSPSFVPSNLTNLYNATGGKFWQRVNSIMIKSGIVSDLTGLLKYIDNQPGCALFIGYGYRSYAEQEGLWKGNNCATDPGCGVAPPGKSTHQAGIALDLFCAEMRGAEIILKTVPASAIANARNFNFIHPITWDTPHFIGL